MCLSPVQILSSQRTSLDAPSSCGRQVAAKSSSTEMMSSQDLLVLRINTDLGG